LRLPPRIRINREAVMLNHDTELFPHHVDGARLYDFSQPVAAVTQHPADKNVWGLKNLSGEKWVGVTADGKVKDVEPGRSLLLSPGTKIQFGKTEGEIRV
jgi:eukaryotic-like serine/threonine-protein kinase